MIEKDDWRLKGQETYLAGKTLYFRKFPKEHDHAHCVFCWEKFSFGYDDTLREGYTTEDERHWICSNCFHDFKEMLQWNIE